MIGLKRKLVRGAAVLLTEEELNEYIDSYIVEGQFGKGDGLLLFPIAK